jgi:hypothetical protein
MQTKKDSSRREERASGIIIEVLEKYVPKYMTSPNEK